MICYVILSILFVSNVHGLTRRELRRFKTDEVQGMVKVTSLKGRHIIESNGVPNHDTELPSNQQNPNTISVQHYVLNIPREPAVTEVPTPLNMGAIGLAINGIPFYNPWTSDGKDAVETETFDVCDGHPDGQNRYHYHKMPSSCLFRIRDGVESSIIGVARDGFPIYGPIDENNRRLKSADLDDCHGRYFNGGYRYHVTDDFPYILGCYKGEVSLGPNGNFQNIIDVE